ncbi:MAG: hypothetical protein MZW92_36785 [Comamonadaceae bacterium]|nr:hypothetical protein [Comamonadaceae bacterium]
MVLARRDAAAAGRPGRRPGPRRQPGAADRAGLRRRRDARLPQRDAALLRAGGAVHRPAPALRDADVRVGRDAAGRPHRLLLPQRPHPDAGGAERGRRRRAMAALPAPCRRGLPRRRRRRAALVSVGVLTDADDLETSLAADYGDIVLSA